MKVRAWTGLLLAVSAVAVSQAAHAECSNDTDCEGDSVCMSGACVNPTAPAQPPLAPLPPGGPAPTAPPQVAPPPQPLPPPVVVAPAAPGPDPGAVPVTFRGADGFVVRTVTRGGQVLQCTSPCTLPLAPGRAEIEIVGQFTDTVVVPNRPAVADISFRKKGLLIAGAVLAGVGLFTVLFGMELKKAYDDCMAQEGTQRSGNTTVTTDCQAKDESTSVMVIGGVIGAAGIGLLIPGIVSRTAVTIPEQTTARSRWSNFTVGIAPRGSTGGYFSARYAF